MKMHNPPHPGEIIRESCVEPLNLTVTEAAQALGVPRKTFSTIFAERLLAFHGNQFRPPRRPTYYPEPEFIDWHVREVFQAPSRFS